MSKFKSNYGLEEGESIVCIGPPGTGKSHLLGSICEVVDPSRVRLLVTKPREKTSELYRRYGLNKSCKVFTNPDWNPNAKRYVADAWPQLLMEIDSLSNDDSIDAVLLDSGTEAVKLLEQSLLAPYKAGTPGELSDTRSYYMSLASDTAQLVHRLTSLSMPESSSGHPKFVMVAWHAQPPKEDMQLSKREGGGTKTSADNIAANIEYMGETLPMMDGKYRRKLAADFSTVVYSDVLFNRQVKIDGRPKIVPVSYAIQVQPTPERHAKVAGASLHSIPERFIDNEFKQLLELIRSGHNPAD